MTEEHTTDKCAQYGEEIKDGVCQNPRENALLCVNCRMNKGRVKPKTKTLDLALGPVEIPIEERPSEEAEMEAAGASKKVLCASCGKDITDSVQVGAGDGTGNVFQCKDCADFEEQAAKEALEDAE